MLGTRVDTVAVERAAGRLAGLLRLCALVGCGAGTAFVLVRGECQWSVVQLFYARIGRFARREVATMTAVLAEPTRDGLAAYGSDHTYDGSDSGP